uniref:Uncharacterized protein n=1 Tax=Anguilla anguilla TaxID=7936 RepID=A0A0E9XYF3_ANGAN
MIFQTVNFGKP